MQVKLVDNVLQIAPVNDSSEANAIAGTMRALPIIWSLVSVMVLNVNWC